MRTAVLIGALALGVLAACATETPSSSSAASVPVVEGVGPGTSNVDPMMAAVLFKRVCVDTGARHSAMLSELAKLPVAKNPRSEIFYHRKMNLSFKMRVVDRKQACSFVVKPTNASTTGILLAATHSPKVTTTANVFGRGYVNALAVPN